MVHRSKASYLVLPSRIEGWPLDARLHWLTGPGELVTPLRPLARLDSGEVIHVPPQVSGRDLLEKCLIGEGRRVIGGEPIARIGEGDRSDLYEVPAQYDEGLREELAPFDHMNASSEEREGDAESMRYGPTGTNFSWPGLAAEVTMTESRAVYASVIEPSGLSALAVVGAVVLAGTLVAAISMVLFFMTGGVLTPMIATMSLASVVSALRFAEYRLDPGGDGRP